jgi:hypothetical protein
MDARVGSEKQRHVGQSITDGDRFDVRLHDLVGRLGSQRQRLAVGGEVGVVFDLLPDLSMDSLWIPRAWRKEVEDQQMVTLK